MYIVDYERGEHDSFMVVDLNDALNIINKSKIESEGKE